MAIRNTKAPVDDDITRLSPHDAAQDLSHAGGAAGMKPIATIRSGGMDRPRVKSHEAKVRTDPKVFAILGIAMLTVVLLMSWLVMRALGSVDRVTETAIQEQTQVALGDVLEYRGTTYQLTKLKSGTYALTSRAEGQETDAVIAELKGTPVALILYNMTFLVPENLSDGTWDIMAHTLGGGSLTQQVTDAQGEAIVREGTIESASLVQDSIEIHTSDGATESISLT
jgi:hypothetical protein